MPTLLRNDAKHQAAERLNDWVDQVSNSPLLGSIGKRAIRELLALSDIDSFEPGHVLMRQGEIGDSAWLVLAGTLDVIEETGLGEVVMNSVGPQAVVGEIAIFSRLPRTATIRVTEPAILMRLTAAAFRDVITRHPETALELLSTLGRRIAAQNKPLAMLSLAAHALEDAELDVSMLDGLMSESGGVGPFAASLKKLLTEMETKRSRRQEMAVAARLQQSILPGRLDFEGLGLPYQIEARMRPARDIGGDFYDFFFTADRKKLIAIVADVSGKGVPAALFMAVSRTWLRASILAVEDVAVALARANTQLEAENPECLFVTAFLAELDLATGRLAYINAGHCDGYVVRANGATDTLPATGPAIGMMPAPRFGGGAVTLGPEDYLVLVSDGVTEAFSPADEEFGDHRLVDRLKGLVGRGPAEVLEAVDEAVIAFADGAEQSDDITCLVLARLPLPQ